MIRCGSYILCGSSVYVTGSYRHLTAKPNKTELGSCLDTYLKCTGFQTVTYHWPMISAVSS